MLYHQHKCASPAGMAWRTATCLLLQNTAGAWTVAQFLFMKACHGERGSRCTVHSRARGQDNGCHHCSCPACLSCAELHQSHSTGVHCHGNIAGAMRSPAKKARTKTANITAAQLARPVTSPMEATAQPCVTKLQLHCEPPQDLVSAPHSVGALRLSCRAFMPCICTV